MPATTADQGASAARQISKAAVGLHASVHRDQQLDIRTKLIERMEHARRWTSGGTVIMKGSQ